MLTLQREPLPHQMTVLILGAKSSPCCANFSLRQTVVEFGHLFEPLISKIVYSSFYVDDCLVFLPTIHEAILTQQGLLELLAKRGFRLRKWITNSDEVLQSIPESEHAEGSQGHPLEDSASERLLGMLWRLKDDVFSFTVEMPQKSLTRRGMLSTLASLFDPLGFVSPVILEGRMMLRNLCRRKAGWDKEVTSSEAERWLQWINRLSALNDLHIPRCFNPTGFGNLRSIKIHNFSDTSLFAYGACAYL